MTITTTTPPAAPPAPPVDILRADWRTDALCTQTDPEAFFPGVGESLATVRKVCKACPVRWECLVEAVDITDDVSIRAGLARKQRERLRTLGVNGAAVRAAGRAGVRALLVRAGLKANDC